MQLQYNTTSDDDGTQRRSSMAWDSTRQPRHGILKKKSPRRLRSAGHLTVPTCDIDDLLTNMTLGDSSASNSITVKASSLYGSPYENCHHYNTSTSVTIRYGLSNQRIQRIRDHESLISFMDIYDLPALLKEVICRSIKLSGESVENDFYCNAYWAVRLTDAIAELVFEKLGISLDDDITYSPSADLTMCVKSISETTHILKHQISVCDWLTTTIGPNYANGNVPYQLGPLLLKEMQKLHAILTSANDMWIDHAVRLLC